MSEIKKISWYPENAITWAIAQLPTKEQTSLKKSLEKVEQFLGDKPTKTLVKARQPSTKDIFEKHIIEKIEDGIRKLQMLDDCGWVQTIDIEINLNNNLDQLSLDELAILHKKVTTVESSVQTIDNFVKFYKGQVYLTAREKCNHGEFMKWLENKIINCSASTVYRYMAYATMIMRYPRLIQCDLNMSQVVKHKERLLTFFSREENSKLAHGVADPVEFLFSGMRIKISPSECNIPHIKGLSFDADWRDLDAYADVSLTDIEPVSVRGTLAISDPSVDEAEEMMLKLSP